MARSPPNTPLFLSSEITKRARKHSAELAGKKQQSEFKLPSISDLDVSLIEKKPSRASEMAYNKATNQVMFSPSLKGKRSGSPINRLLENLLPAQESKSGSERQPNPNPRVDRNSRQSSEESGQSPNLDPSSQKYSGPPYEPINWLSAWLYVKLILFSYEFNLLDYLKAIDPQTADKVVELLKIAPGYKPIQYVYTFYMLKYGALMGVLAAVAYPLPYSILFLMITIDLQVPFVAIFMLAGMRSGAIALLLKYSLHFPKQVFHWIVLVFTVLIGILLPNNYIFLLLFGISIFLSFYLPNNEQSRTSLNLADQSRDRQTREEPGSLIASSFGLDFNEREIYKEYKVYDQLPETYGAASIGVLCCAALFLWILERYNSNREVSIFGQIMPISLLGSSKEMLAFFPFIYREWIGSSTLSPNTLISLSFLFPGPHSKAFMFFIIHTQLKNVLIGYGCLYLPSILLINIFISYRPYFYTRTYYNIRQSIQAVGNGIVFCLVFWMLSNQPCFFKSICYSAVVIMVVAKLYKLRELFAITLGIFLISARTIILNINKEIPFEVQACLDSNNTFAS